MEIKRLAKGNVRLYYYGSDECSLDTLGKIVRTGHIFLCTFFRAENMESIKGKVSSVKGDCIKDAPFDQIPMGKKVKFIAGDPMEFEGTAIGVVRIRKDQYLEIEIIPGELYFYSRVGSASKDCYLLKVVT